MKNKSRPFHLQNRPRLVVFVKAPILGRCKTRLAKEIGYGAINFYRHSTRRLIKALYHPRLWQMILAIDPLPETFSNRAALWPSNIARMTQPKGDLGQRMGYVFDHAPPGPVIIIGSDTPHIDPSLIGRGFDRLRRDDAIFGPAMDGGYWLIGMARRRAAPDLFSHVRWSSPMALSDSLASLPQHFAVSHLPILRDIDDKSDLAALPDVTRQVKMK